MSNQVDSLNLFTPVLDGVESPGRPGEVLRSLGAYAAPVWASPSASALLPGPGSSSDLGIHAAPVSDYLGGASFTGQYVLIAPAALGGLESIGLHIRGYQQRQNGSEQGFFDLLVYLQLNSGNLRHLSVQGVAPDLEVQASLREIDGRLGILLGTSSTEWRDAHFTMSALWADGATNAASMATPWRLQEVARQAEWPVRLGAVPVGPSLPLTNATEAGGGGGRLTVGLGGYQQAAAATGALVFALPKEPAVFAGATIGSAGTGTVAIEVVGTGAAVCGMTFFRFMLVLDLEADGVGVRVRSALQVNLGPDLPPVVRAGSNAVAEPVLVFGAVGDAWHNGAVSLVLSVFSRLSGATLRPHCPGQLAADLTGYQLPVTADLRLLGTAGTGGGIDLTAGAYLLGGSYDGLRAVTFDVNASIIPDASKLVARNPNGDAYANHWFGNLRGNADTATRLQTPRTINGIPFDGTSDIVVSAVINQLLALRPGAYLLGNPWSGNSAETWEVDASSTATPGKIAARDGSGDLFANVFVGNLRGIASDLDIPALPALP